MPSSQAVAAELASSPSTPSSSPTRAPALRLALAALGLLLPLAAVLVAPQPPLWLDHPTPRPVLDASAPTLGWTGILVTAGFILFLCLPYHPYSLALRLLRQERIPRWALFGLTGVIAAVGLLIYPHFGSDVFDYAAYERLWVIYAENPLFGIVANHPADWIVPFVNVADRTPAYGPLWAVLTWPIVRLAPDSALGLVLGYKALSLAVYAGCCWLIWSSVEAERRQRALALFAWSPLVIFEVLGKLHNDSLLALSMLSMVWLLSRKYDTRGWLAIVGGGLIKATALVAAPLVGLRTFRQSGWRGLLPLVLAGSASTAVAYLPFWNGPRTLAPIWQQTSGLGFSLATVFTVAISPSAEDAAAMAVRVALALTWLIVASALLLRHRLDSPAELAAATGWLLIATLCLLTGALYGHYFVPVVALAAVSGEPLLERAAKWLSIGGLALYGVGAIGWALDPLWIGTLSYQVAGAAILFGPAILNMLLPVLAGPLASDGARSVVR